MAKQLKNPEKEACLTLTECMNGTSDSRYRLLLDNVSDAVFIHHGPDERDMPGKIIDVNEEACCRLGYTREELLRMSPADLDAPETIRSVPVMMRKLFRDKQAVWKGTHIRKDGHRIPVEIRNVLFYHDDKPLILSTVRDDTERNQAQEDLRKSAEELRFIAESVGDIIWQMNPEICFTYVSPAVRKVLGYEPQEVVGQNLFTFLTAAGEEMVRPVWAEWYAQLAEGIQRDELLFEMEAVHKSGQSVWLEVQARPLLDARRNVIHYHGVTRDITQRRLLTERLNRAEKMESLGILAGGVAHDLNNVLGVIVGYSELIMQGMSPEDPLYKFLSDIMKSSEKSAAIIQDLLALARRGVVVCEAVDLNNVIFEFFRSIEFERLKNHHRKVGFETDLAGDLMPINGSRVHLGKVIMNLLSNAAESISAQGAVRLSTENRRIDKPITAYDEIKQGDYVVLKVSDNGQGISKADSGKIFEPFYTKKVMGRSGTGLGLAVVWGTVKDHNGYIDVQSSEGEGSTFSIYFPATREKVNREKKKAAMDSYMGRGESILVVDDSADQRQLALVMLARLNYAVQAVSSGEEAVEFLKNHQMDLVVIDMIMDPGIDGLDTYRKIAGIRPGQKAILVSGFSETGRVKEAQNLGAGVYVHKPYTLERIGLAIRNELAR